MKGHINPAVIDELREIMFDEFPLLVDVFLEESQKQIAGVLDAADEGEMERVRRNAHSLKGSSSNIGAEHLAELCLQLETTAGREDVSAIAPLVARIQSELAGVNDEIVRYRS